MSISAKVRGYARKAKGHVKKHKRAYGAAAGVAGLAALGAGGYRYRAALGRAANWVRSGSRGSTKKMASDAWGAVKSRNPFRRKVKMATLK